jgi:hypothetical protein
VKQPIHMGVEGEQKCRRRRVGSQQWRDTQRRSGTFVEQQLVVRHDGANRGARSPSLEQLLHLTSSQIHKRILLGQAQTVSTTQRVLSINHSVCRTHSQHKKKREREKERREREREREREKSREIFGSVILSVAATQQRSQSYASKRASRTHRPGYKNFANCRMKKTERVLSKQTRDERVTFL